MSNRGNGLATLALLIGLCGTAFGGYAIFLMPSGIIEQASGSSEVTQIWTVEQTSDFSSVDGSWTNMTDMSVSITVRTGETVYITFNAYVHSSAVASYLVSDIGINQDGVLISKSLRKNSKSGTGTAYLKDSMTTQFIIENLAAGTYEYKVQVRGGGLPGDIVSVFVDGLLMIYTYR